MIRTVLSKIKSDVRHYSTFIRVLEENERLYESVLEKIRSTKDEGIITIHQPTSPRLFPNPEREQSDNEMSPFLHTPYVEYIDTFCIHRLLR